VSAQPVEQRQTDIPPPTVRSRIRDVIEQTNLSDPHEIAQAVAKGMTRAERERVFVDILTPYVLNHLGMERRTAQGVTLPRQAPVKSSSSAKRAEYRDWWDKLCGIPIVGADGTYIRMGRATAEDLDAAAARRHEQAAANTAAAVQYEKAAAAMREHGVKTLDGLPREVAVQVWGQP
jgi:hypothetical protein